MVNTPWCELQIRITPQNIQHKLTSLLGMSIGTRRKMCSNKPEGKRSYNKSLSSFIYLYTFYIYTPNSNGRIFFSWGWLMRMVWGGGTESWDFLICGKSLCRLLSWGWTRCCAWAWTTGTTVQSRSAGTLNKLANNSYLKCPPVFFQNAPVPTEPVIFNKVQFILLINVWYTKSIAISVIFYYFLCILKLTYFRACWSH